MSVYIDRGRAASRLDVGGRGALVALGAAAESMRVLAAGEGRGSTFVPVGVDDHIIDVVIDGGDPDPLLCELAPHLDRRVTNRRHDPTAAPIDTDVLARLNAGVTSVGARMSVLSDGADLAAYGRILGESDRLRYLTADLHRELLHELRFGDEPPSARGTGIAVSTLELDVADQAKLAITRRGDVMAQLREWGTGTALTEPAKKVIAASGAAIALTMPRTTPDPFVRGGQALLRLWVSACAEGLSVQPVSPIWLYAREAPDYGGILEADDVADVAEVDAEMATMFDLGDDALVIVLRLSLAPPATSVSGRLPVAEILENEVD